MKTQVRPKPAKARYINPIIHKKTPQEMLQPTLVVSCEVNRTHVFRVKRQTVAIVVVPGIMASRLADLENSAIWDPDDTLVMGAYLFATPPKRHELIFGKGRKVMTQGGADPYKGYPKARERGWPGISWDCYGKLLGDLQTWNTPLKKLLDLPVYAFGYDWVESNRTTGKRLQQFIADIKADKIIIVTHSMGGLVSRYALAGEGGAALAERVLGVVHGAQPVHGAPDAYHRQIAGTGGGILNWAISRVLGSDGPHITAIFPHSPAALQLLPNQFYRTNHGSPAWLHIQDLDDPERFSSYPQSGDPYQDIYLKSAHRDFWGMIHGEWFQPKAEGPEIIERSLKGDISGGDRTAIEKSIAWNLRKHLFKAKEFHEIIGSYCHPRTVQLFSSGGNKTVSEVCWLAKDITKFILETASFQHFANTHLAFNTSRASAQNATFLREVKDADRQGFGKYREFRWRKQDGSLGEIVPLDARLADIRRRITAEGLRLYQLRISEAGEDVVDRPGGSSTHLGDGTVPLGSATGIKPDLSGWGPNVHLLPYWEGPGGERREATGRVNQKEHSAFYDDNAVKAVKRIVHNLCFGWLKGEFT
ncbi:MAG TPA: hypothetical protein DGF30_11835 [Desulfomicrobium sp.]|nr:hypothetical protein [Desulfomicrobium sp.]